MDFKDINSHEAACKVLGKDPAQSITADQKITDVFHAVNMLNNYYEADFSNDLRKWRPFFIMDSSGFRFGFSTCVSRHSTSDVGSRLCHYVSSEAEADHIGRTFIDLHKEHYMGERLVKKITFKDIQTHEAACKILDKSPEKSTTPEQKITDIFKAVNKLNGNFKADFTNNDQEKWRPFFIMDSSGFRFDFSYYVNRRSITDVGSRLCHYVSSREEADYLGTQFLELHKEHYLGD